MVMDPMVAARRDVDEKPLGLKPPKRKDFLQHWQRRADAMRSSRETILDARDLESGRLVVTSPDARRNGMGTVAATTQDERVDVPELRIQDGEQVVKARLIADRSLQVPGAHHRPFNATGDDSPSRPAALPAREARSSTPEAAG